MDRIPAPERSVSFEVVLDATNFSSLQIHQRWLMTTAINACVRWLRDYYISHEQLMKQFRAGFVLYGLHLDYLEPLRHGQAQSLQVTCTARVRQDGSYLENHTDFTTGDRKVAHVQNVWASLWLEDNEQLAAVAATMPAELLSRFRPEELDPTPYRSPVGPLAEAAASGRLLAVQEERFSLHRHQCEFDDKWYSAEGMGLCGAVRESLALAHGREKPELRKGLSLPLRSIDIHLTRPIYLLDQFRVQTHAYAVDERLTFVHRFIGAGGDALCATFVEQF